MLRAICLAGLLVTSAGAMTAAQHQQALNPLLATLEQTIARGPYSTEPASLDGYGVPEWYADAKLGIFIHYGLFSVPGYAGVGCWYGNNMYDPRNGAWAFHRDTFGPQSTFGYKDFAPHLTASAFDADQWVGLFKEAGARFVVPVSCFHDGYCMWDSKLTDWTAVKTGPRRDYDGQLAAATRRAGLKFGVAWHAFFHNQFFAPGRRSDSDVREPNAGPPWSVYGPATDDPPSREFIDDSLGRLVELVDGYRPDLVWFDFDTGYVPPADLRRFSAFYLNRAAQWGRGVAINDKHEGLFPRCIVLDFERGKTAGLRADLWQTDTSVSWRDWSYIRNDAFKTTDEIVRELVDIVSKNGVLLLDVGPRPDGSIPPEPQALLRGVGAWLKVNGEAIYGTRPCWALGYGEGPHNSGGGGFSDRAVEYNSHDFRFTQKGGTIYAVAMDWPDVADEFVIRAFNDSTTVASGGITGVRLLGAREPLDWKLAADGLHIRKPARRPCDGAFAFAITTGGVALEALDAERLDEQQLRITAKLRNLDAKPAAPTLQLAVSGQAAGTTAFALKPGETVAKSWTVAAPQRTSAEVVTASLPGGKPFVTRAELYSPPDAAASRQFDGTTMLTGGGLGALPKLTLSLWARTDDLREPWSALFNTAGWSKGGLHVQLTAEGALQVSLHNGGGVDGRSGSTPGRAKGWRLLTVTYDQASGQAVLYVDGRPDGELHFPAAPAADLSSFTLGGWTSGGRRYLGRLADVRLWSRVLSADEVHGLLTGKAPADGLLAAWRFPGLTDTTGHGHALTETK